MYAGKLNPVMALTGCTIKLIAAVMLPLGLSNRFRDTYLTILLILCVIFVVIHRGEVLSMRWRVWLLSGSVWSVAASLLAPHVSRALATGLLLFGWSAVVLGGCVYTIIVCVRMRVLVEHSGTEETAATGASHVTSRNPLLPDSEHNGGGGSHPHHHHQHQQEDTAAVSDACLAIMVEAEAQICSDRHEVVIPLGGVDKASLAIDEDEIVARH